MQTSLQILQNPGAVYVCLSPRIKCESLRFCFLFFVNFVYFVFKYFRSPILFRDLWGS
jgi:hypothetical protein